MTPHIEYDYSKCRFCGETVDTNRAGYYVLVQGWAEIRKEGGANALKHKEHLGPIAHRYCVAYNPQEQLFQDAVQERFPIAEEVKRERFG